MGLRAGKAFRNTQKTLLVTDEEAEGQITRYLLTFPKQIV